ncbi:hypothetical protein BZG36_04082 [Bifiguratus adelaidae]|uniref:Hexosyltransferase n=1 Tax=Bifiguratus adelaidae TaxID=1938954 RepID=A0A261XWZ8_9FUNG|nr:hypothetical protein BZG36_04082 [Bifiguratus adelaidae]
MQIFHLDTSLLPEKAFYIPLHRTQPLRSRIASIPTVYRLLVLVILVAALSFYGRWVYVMNAPNMGVPVKWEYHCKTHAPFNKTLYDHTPRARILVGLLTKDSTFLRRQLIRSTYLQYQPPTIIFRFILGRPQKEYLPLVAEEMRLYGDVIVLDMEENMNEGKTLEYFKWVNRSYNQTNGEYARLDYVVKADDDSMINLWNLERALRVLPRKGAYWGCKYSILNSDYVGKSFMGGECYGLSSDLVHWIATDPLPSAYPSGHEDSQVHRWLRWGHQNATYIAENCYIFDGPQANSVYSRPYGKTPSSIPGQERETIVVHGLKTEEDFLEAGRWILPSAADANRNASLVNQSM